MELEDKIVALRASLESALVDVKMKTALAEQLAQEKSGLEVQLTETKEVISRLQSQQQAGESVLESLREDVSFFCAVPGQSSAT